MINISKLYCDQVTPGDWLRYGKTGSGEREGEVLDAGRPRLTDVVAADPGHVEHAEEGFGS